MGKKSRRKKGSKVDANEVVLENILNNLQNLADIVTDKIEKKRFSEAASRARDVITNVATQEKALMKASALYFPAALVKSYRVLMFIEYDFRKNYGKVIEIYNDLASKYSHVLTLGTEILEENMPSDFSIDMKTLQLFYELALIRTDKSLCNVPIIKSFILRLMKDEPTEKAMILKDRVIDALRVAKDYDNAIDLDCQLLRSPNLVQREPFEVTASLLTSYIERYRVEKYQSLQSARAENYSEIMCLFNIIPDEYEIDDSYKHDYYDFHKHDYFLAIAQLDYLCHTKDNNEQVTRNYLEGAIRRVERIARTKWMFRNECSTCREKSNIPSKLQLVCRDCRVSCYCGIDHQRECWMKNEVQGTRLGHKVFCPVLRAYRIWMEAKENDDVEREAKMERRFKKECIAFLAYGLGLKDKCFEVAN